MYDKDGRYIEEPTKNPNDNLPPGWVKGGWEADQKKKVQAAQDAINYRNNNLLSRMSPTLADTSAQQAQIAQSRGAQLASLGNLQQSAMGLGPSYARAQAAQALGQGLGKLNMGGANALAFRNNLMAGNQALGNINAEGAMARNKEMGQAMNAFGTGAQAVRGGDLGGQQSAIAQLGRQQALNLQNAKSNQGLVQGLEGLNMDLDMANSKSAQDWYNLWVQRNSAQADQNAKETQAAIQAMVAAMAAASDIRVKKEVR